MVEGRVFLSILVNEWYLMPECWLSLGLVKSIPFLTFDPFAAQLLSLNQGRYLTALWDVGSERGRICQNTRLDQ
jgi:hypothetical protein